MTPTHTPTPTPTMLHTCTTCHVPKLDLAFPDDDTFTTCSKCQRDARVERWANSLDEMTPGRSYRFRELQRMTGLRRLELANRLDKGEADGDIIINRRLRPHTYTRRDG